jgi:hypothetical protein
MSTFFEPISAEGDPDFIYYKDGDIGRCLWKVREPMPTGDPLVSLTGKKLSKEEFTSYDDCDDCFAGNALNTLYVRYE